MGRTIAKQQQTAQKPQQNAIEAIPDSADSLAVLGALRPVQQQAMTLLLRGVPVQQVVREIGKSDQTIYNWTKLPQWIRAWNACKEDWRNRSLRLLQEHAESTAQAVIDTARDGNTNAQRTHLEAVGLLKSNSAGASSTNPLQAALAAISVNIRVEQPQKADIEVIDATDGDIVKNE